MSVRSRSPRKRRCAQTGFTLLEALVAFTIMAISLGLLYRAMGGSADGVARVAGQQQAVLLAQSLLATHDYLGPGGWNGQGESAGMQWRVASRPYQAASAVAAALQTVALHEVEIDIRWNQQGRPGEWRLTTLLPQRQPVPGETMK